MYGVYTVFLAGKSPNIQSYTVYIYGSGQPYVCLLHSHCDDACRASVLCSDTRLSLIALFESQVSLAAALFSGCG